MERINIISCWLNGLNNYNYSKGLEFEFLLINIIFTLSPCLVGGNRGWEWVFHSQSIHQKHDFMTIELAEFVTTINSHKFVTAYDNHKWHIVIFLKNCDCSWLSQRLLLFVIANGNHISSLFLAI